ncbi:MAG TPA: hypothetical protein VHB46_09455 [Burkholderiales bacterium]|nr:hypothetical protein [Burkholderiales bacterium]
MKPTLPEDRELEEMRAEVSERYRPAANDEPTARLDAKILEAARNEVKPARRKREWQIPASIAAVLVLAVSLGLVVRDHIPPPEVTGQGKSTADEARLAKPAQPALAMQDSSRQMSEAYREARPSRERSDRPDRQLLASSDATPKGQSKAMPQSAAPEHANGPVQSRPPAEADASAQSPASFAAVADAVAPGAAAPAAPGIPAPAPSSGARSFGEAAEKEQANVASLAVEAKDKKAESAGLLSKRVATAQAVRKQDAPPPSPQEWVHRIEDLLKDGKRADARDQLLAMRRQYPAYPLTEQLQALLGGQH